MKGQLCVVLIYPLIFQKIHLSDLAPWVSFGSYVVS